jgi:hypothetical protein
VRENADIAVNAITAGTGRVRLVWVAAVPMIDLSDVGGVGLKKLMAKTVCAPPVSANGNYHVCPRCDSALRQQHGIPGLS